LPVAISAVLQIGDVLFRVRTFFHPGSEHFFIPDPTYKKRDETGKLTLHFFLLLMVSGASLFHSKIFIVKYLIHHGSGKNFSPIRIQGVKKYRYWIPDPQHCISVPITVASRPKILLNNSKPAVEKNDWPGKFGGRTAAEFWQKRPKKNILKKTCFFPIEYLVFKAIVFTTFSAI
jgi:hypothetical protein